MKVLSTKKQKEHDKYVDRIDANADVITDLVHLISIEKNKKLVELDLRMIECLAAQICTYTKRL